MLENSSMVTNSIFFIASKKYNLIHFCVNFVKKIGLPNPEPLRFACLPKRHLVDKPKYHDYLLYFFPDLALNLFKLKSMKYFTNLYLVILLMQALVVQSFSQVIPPKPIIRINTGGNEFGSWSADQYNTGGDLYTAIIPIANTTNDALYQTERNDRQFSYAIPVPSAGYYRVNLHFAEIYHGVGNSRGVGTRVFNVSAEGKQVLTNYDIYLAAGGPAKAIIQPIDSVQVLDGFLTLNFTSTVDKAKISAIEVEIYTLATVPNTPPFVQNPGNRYIFEGGIMSIPVIASDFDLEDILQYQATGLPAALSINQNTGLIAGTIEAIAGSYPVTVTVTDGKGGSTQVNFNINVVAPINYVQRINSGGIKQTFGTEVWDADNFFLEGKTFTTTADITNTTKDAIYQSERFGNKLTYQIPMPGAGRYKVSLHFAEIFKTSIGTRVFNVNIESGQASLTNYDIFQRAGGAFLAVSEPFVVNVTDGFLSLVLASLVDQTKISGIEISSCVSPLINTITASVPEICQGGSSTITVAGSIGSATTWNLYTASCGGTPVASNITGIFLVTPTVNTTYYVRGEGGCVLPGTCTSLEIKVKPLPIATITAAGPFCTGDASVNLIGATAGGVWSGTGITSASLGTFNPATAGAGSHVITYTITTNGCTSLDTETIQVIQGPNATITSAVLFCDSDAILNFTATTAGGTWSGTGITNASLGTFNPAVAGPGSHAITYSVTAGSCTSSDTKTVQVLSPTADPTITAAGPFCQSSGPVNLTAATPGGTWSGTGITDASAGTFNPTTAGPGNFVITYTLSAGSCISSDTETIQVDAVSNATITVAGPFCVSDLPVTLVAATGGGIWSGAGITSASSGTFNPAIAGPGNHVITYTIVSGACTSVDTETISIPDATIDAAGPFCVTSASVTLKAFSSGGTWSGTGITNASLGIFNPATAGPGNHIITYTVNAGACTSTDTETIKVDAIPDATITAAGPFCGGNAPVNLVAATAGGTWSGKGITSASLGTFSPTVAGAGNHVITYTIVGGTCTSTDTETIQINPQPISTILTTDPFCTSDSPVTLRAETPGGVWSGIGITSASLGTFDPSVAGSGSHVITYTLTVGTCTSVSTATIKVDAIPDLTITAAGPFCADAASVTLKSATAGGTWSGTGITNALLGTFAPATAGVGSHLIGYTITNGACTSLDTETIRVDAKPVASIAAAGPFCPGDTPVTLTATASGGTWSGKGITSASLGTFSPSVAGAGSHVITYTVVAGACTSTDTKTVIVKAVNATVTLTGNTLTASATGATYQWINCTGNTNIAGETSKTFTPAQSGSYKVSVTENGCTLISVCMDVVIVGVGDSYGDRISVYPNPASSVITIDLPAPSTNILIDITDVTGKSSLRNAYDYGKTIDIDASSLTQGLYFINIKTSDSRSTIKVMVK